MPPSPPRALSARLLTSCLTAMPSCCTVPTCNLESRPMVFLFQQSLGFRGPLWTWSELTADFHLPLETTPRGQMPTFDRVFTIFPCQHYFSCILPIPSALCQGFPLPPPPPVPVLIVLARGISTPLLSLELFPKSSSSLLYTIPDYHRQKLTLLSFLSPLTLLLCSTCICSTSIYCRPTMSLVLF